VVDAPAAPTRWNPFSFPSDVDFAFALLVAVILGTSLLIYLAIANDVSSGFEAASVGSARCEAQAGPLHPDDTLTYRETWLTTFNSCQSAHRAAPGWVLVGLAVLLCGAVAGYLRYPAWKIRRDELEPVTAEDAPEMVQELRSLCGIAGLANEPAFLWNPLDASCGGLAFGRPGRRFVALSGGLATKLWTDPELFRAVVLHELAHLRNGDVDKAYLMVAIWWSFVATALVPFAITLAWSDPGVALRRGLSIAALAVVVYLLRNAALRARETYADVRASAWPPALGGLDRALPEEVAPGRGPASWPVHVRRWWSRHPTPSTRRAAIRDTSALFGTSFWFAAGTGLAGSLALLGVQAVVDLLVPGLGDWTGALLFASLIVGVTGLALWRSAFLASARGGRVDGVWRSGVALAGGVALGDLLSLSATASIPAGFDLSGAPLLVFDMVWYGLLLAGCIFFLRWVVACASAWLPVMATHQSPRRTLAGVVPPAALVLAVGLEFLFSIVAVRATGGILPASLAAKGLSAVSGAPIPVGPYLDAALALAYLVLRVATSPFFYAAVQLLWLMPLAAWLFRRRAAPVRGAAWALLEPAPADHPVRMPPPLRPVVSAITGAAGGLLFGAVTVPLSVLLLPTSPDALATWLTVGQPVLGILIQSIVATALALSIRRLGVVHALFGAFVCGGVIALMSIGAAVSTAGVAAIHIQGLAAGAVTTSLNVGALFVIPLAVGSAGLATFIRRIAGGPSGAP
jgi:Zn-dependent protease with chaperone function